MTGGININDRGPENIFTEKFYEADLSAQQLGAVEISDRDTGIEIVPAGGSRLRVTYYESEKIYYVITLTDGVLRVEKQGPAKWYDNIFDLIQRKKLILSLPCNFTGDISAVTANAAIAAEDVTVSEMGMRTSNGAVKCGGLNVKRLVAETSNSGVILSALRAEDDIVARTSNGKVDLSRVRCASLRAVTSNGAVKLSSVNAGRGIDARTSNGKIAFDDIEFETELTLTTSNGSIKGSVGGKMSDYTIRSAASNGRNNLPGHITGGDRQITATTSNGAIDIEFCGDR
ncbi:MAG: DUF4097 family beta strand repeat-containing protein [Eubacteriales bacterium]|nr:DUF4097 family beta strand repeat-containing protein [Eubacteriales bacterium]